MVHLSRIYTRTGDDGTTALGDMTRTGKNDPRLIAFADVDEANCAIGVALALEELDSDVTELLLQVQNDLFDVGADLCTPVSDAPREPALRVTQDYIDFLESACDKYNEPLKPLSSFVLPGGTHVAAQLHVARTVTRRAERATWAALHMYHGGMNQLTATYLNRLSDLLFILSRHANRELGDTLWESGRRQK